MIARNSLHWILIPFILGLIQFLTPFWILGIILVLISLFFLIFFRDPERTPGEGIVSPADGRISNLEEGENEWMISIVMGISDVHVNRALMDGQVLSMEHVDGNHVMATNKDSENNERQITLLDTEVGEVRIVQIAGAFARRIVPYIKGGDMVSKGDRIGIIRFGSRVDVHLPKENVEMAVGSGSKVKAGVSQLAVIKDES